jgi:hypothetical protein
MRKKSMLTFWWIHMFSPPQYFIIYTTILYSGLNGWMDFIYSSRVHHRSVPNEYWTF